MVVAKEILKKAKKRPPRQSKGETSMPKKKTIEEIEKEFGFDKVRPIIPSPSDEMDMLEKGDCFKEWYEEELRDYCDRGI